MAYSRNLSRVSEIQNWWYVSSSERKTQNENDRIWYSATPWNNTYNFETWQWFLRYFFGFPMNVLQKKNLLPATMFVLQISITWSNLELANQQDISVLLELVLLFQWKCFAHPIIQQFTMSIFGFNKYENLWSYTDQNRKACVSKS